MKQPYKVRLCQACGRKRHLFWETRNRYRYWTCSKGHKWNEKLGNTFIINQIFTEVFQDFISDYYNLDNCLSKFMRKR